MAQKDTYMKESYSTPENRQASRAFRRAMSSGLSKTYDNVTSHDVPDDFMDLLRQADERRTSEA